MEIDRIICGDCLEVLPSAGDVRADLVFADPPFNIGFGYDVYRDNRDYEEYYQWTRQWMQACCDFLSPTGSFWVAIGSEYAAEVRMIGRECGLHLRNWIIWHYTFGQNTKAKFARAHVHLFYFTKDPREFTFHADAVRVMSDRQKEYADKRAHPMGRVPFDVWTEFSRICGTFDERQGWHPCQMPESLLARIVRACSDPGDMVFDPFGGSGTTLATAKKMGRRFLGTEISPDYVKGIEQRLAAIPWPAEAIRNAGDRWPAFVCNELASLYAETSLALEDLLGNEYLWEVFLAQFRERMLADGYDPEKLGLSPQAVEAELKALRKGAKLPRIRVFSRSEGSGSGPAPRGKRTRKTKKARPTQQPRPASGALFE